APTLTAADGVRTSVPSFPLFFGTSAAAPHAAAIAALIWSFNPSLSQAEVRQVLLESALDIEEPGPDRDSGVGVVMALGALERTPTPEPRLGLRQITMLDASGNGSLDARECAELFVSVANLGSARGPAARNVVGHLRARSPGVITEPEPVAFGDIGGGQAATNSLPLRLSAGAGLLCGIPAEMELELITANVGSFVLPFTLPSTNNGLDAPRLFASSNVPLPIPDLGLVESTVLVEGLARPVGEVVVSVHITHSYAADLTLQLIGPDGTEVELSSLNGGSDDHYGTGCLGRTTFADDAPQSIVGASAPFVGRFRPEERLAVFVGKHGAAANGLWRLRVADTSAQDAGTLECWTLAVASFACFDGGGECLLPPSLLAQPESLTVTNGDAARFEVTAEGAAPLSFQWFHEASPLPGATNASLLLPAATPGDAGAYSVVVSNRFGTVTSAPAQLTVVVPPLITLEPQDLLATNGHDVAFAIVVVGSVPLTYQWRFNGVDIPGANGPTLELADISPAAQGDYSAVVTNPYGIAVSRTARLTVVSPPVLVRQPQDLKVTLGEEARFEAEATGSEPLSYQWFFNESEALPEATNATLVLPAVGTNQTGTYQLVVSNPYGTATSVEAALVVVVPNSPPAVVLLEPVDGAQFDLTAGPLVIHAEASDADGIIRSLDLRADEQVLARNASSPARLAWPDPWPGPHRLDAVAMDNTGARGTSQVATVTVQFEAGAALPLVATGSVWRYLDAGVDQGTAWRAPAFDDPAWPEARAELGYGDEVDGRPEATVISFGPDPNRKHPTYYFRRAFTLTDAGAFTNAELALLRDDGAVVYLNGVEIFRDNMPTGEVAFTTFATRAVPRAEETNYFRAPVDVSLLRNGLNVVAVEVHQANRTSSDVSFDLGLTGWRWLGPRLVTQPASLTVTQGGTATFSVDVLGPEPRQYQWFFAGTNVLAEATNRTLVLTDLAAAQAGDYAVEVSNPFGLVRSTTARLTVVIPNQPPQVRLTAPAEGAVHALESGPLTVVAEATDERGFVEAVTFYANGPPLGTVETHPFQIEWSDPIPGVASLWAVAMDDEGARQTSAVVTVTVVASNGVVVTSLIETGAVWRYLDTGIDPGTAWRELSFDDSAWLAGPAELGYGDAAEGRPEATVLDFGPNPNAKRPASYFRRPFTVTAPGLFTDLELHLLRDDGAVVYLNGVEVFRSNMPTGLVQMTTLALAAIGGADETTFLRTNLGTLPLRAGTNVVAVEVHQSSVRSSDLSFDLALTGTRYFAPVIVN
ncbi:MAG TPA: immunoglobulin domain-containing protein, partial [Methylomirabilota bacterium]|nr:immunoglobulin domain-containing protein [Methylomirabilota bacterium]